MSKHSRCPLCGGAPAVAHHFILPQANDDMENPVIPSVDEYDPDVVCQHFVAHCGKCGLCARPAWRCGDDAWGLWESLVAKFPPIMRAKIGDLIEACPYAGECNYEPKKLYIHGVDREKNTVYVADVKPNKQETLVDFSFFDTEMPAAYVDNWNLKEVGGES